MGLYGYGFIVCIGAGDLFYVCLVCFIYVYGYDGEGRCLLDGAMG
jgi:hypothetical protein